MKIHAQNISKSKEWAPVKQGLVPSTATVLTGDREGLVDDAAGGAQKKSTSTSWRLVLARLCAMITMTATVLDGQVLNLYAI